MKIIVSRQELQAALLFASNDDSRPVLNAVCIEVSARGHKPTIVSTDGRRLAVIQSQAEQAEEFDESNQIVLAADFIKPICALSKALGGKIFPWIQFVTKAGSKQVQVELIGGKLTLDSEEGALVEGQYPNWKQVVPSRKLERTQINDLGINAEFVGDFAKCAKIFDLNPVIQINLIAKDSALEVKLSGAEYFYGLIMPCKAEEETDYQPEFLQIIKDLPTPEPEQPETEAGESELEDTVTISTPGVKPVTMTTKQFSAAAKKLSKK